MIALSDVTHEVVRYDRRVPVLAGASFAFDRRRMGLIGPWEDQIGALLDLLAGYRLPGEGTVTRFGRVSWPIGRLVQFRSELTGRDTVRFISQLYALDYEKCEQLLFELIDFEHFYDFSIAEWPRLLNVKFGQAAVLLPDFDIYLAESSLIVSDDDFMAKWLPRFNERLQSRQLIMACGQAVYLRRFCRSVAVLKGGRLACYPSVDSAFEAIAWVEPQRLDERIVDAAPVAEDEL